MASVTGEGASLGNGGMILTGDNRSIRGKTCRNVTLSTTNLTWIDLGLIPELYGREAGCRLPEPRYGQHCVLTKITTWNFTISVN